MTEQRYKRTEAALAGGRRLYTRASDSERMARVRQRSTAPELAVRRIAHSLGLRYTTRNRDLPGSPDLANRRRRIAIFVHGCYWHRHPHCSKATTPRANRAFWLAKFARNRARDRSAQSALREMGYAVVILWECETQTPAHIESQLRPLLAGS